jgi:hypothetical protein
VSVCGVGVVFGWCVVGVWCVVVVCEMNAEFLEDRGKRYV